MLDLIKIIPKIIKNKKGGRKYRLHITFHRIPKNKKKLKKNEIGVWYETKTPTSGKVIYYAILPRFINEDRILYESIGLYLAEGSLDSEHLNFSNDEPEVINTFIKAFQKHFRIAPYYWLWSINFNDKLRKFENTKETVQREKASLNFWLKKTKIKATSAFQTPIRYSNKNSKGKLATKKKWGSLTIAFGNKILKLLWLNIIYALIKKTLKEKNEINASSILRGWIAGDGYCRYEIYDKPRRGLGIICKDKNKIMICYKLFNILGIKPYREKNGLMFARAEYLLRAYNHKLTSLHLQKHLNLLLALLSFRRIPDSLKYLDFKRIRKEIKDVKKELKEREKLFERLKNERMPKLRMEIPWQSLINGLVLKKGGKYKKLIKEIGCPQTVLINWVRKGIKPSRKYQMKILEKVKRAKKEQLIKFGEFFLKGDWKAFFEGLQIFLKASRKEIAKRLRIHVNTLESIINQREKVGKHIASKAFNLIERYGKTPEEIVQIYLKSQKTNWPSLIRRILIENEWSQRKLAEKIGCSRSLIREWLKGVEPVNKYKGKLLEIPKYEGKIKFNFKTIIKNALEIYTLSELKEKLNVSPETLQNWKKGSKIQFRNIKRIIKLNSI